MRFESMCFAGRRHLETVSKKKMNFLAKGGGGNREILNRLTQADLQAVQKTKSPGKSI